jgi:hypothetical protein
MKSSIKNRLSSFARKMYGWLLLCRHNEEFQLHMWPRKKSCRPLIREHIAAHTRFENPTAHRTYRAVRILKPPFPNRSQCARVSPLFVSNASRAHAPLPAAHPPDQEPPTPPAVRMSGAALCAALTELGFDGEDSLDADALEWPFQYEEARPLLAWICSCLRPSNVLSPSHLAQ